MAKNESYFGGSSSCPNQSPIWIAGAVVEFDGLSRQILAVGGVRTIRSSSRRAMSPWIEFTKSMSSLIADLVSSSLRLAIGVILTISMLPSIIAAFILGTSFGSRNV